MMTMDALKAATNRALNIAGKWRQVFAGWQLGSRLDFDPECKAIRDHREATIMLRIELSAIAGLLVKKNLITEQEYYEAMKASAEQFCKDMEDRFKGMKAGDNGITMTNGPELHATMKGWRP